MSISGKRDRWQSSSSSDEDTASHSHLSRRTSARSVLSQRKDGTDSRQAQSGKTPPEKSKGHGLDVDSLRRRSLWKGCRDFNKYYELLNKISEGSFGCVYRGRSRETGKIIALKSFKRPKVLESEGFLTAGLREISSLLTLRHPNVIEVVEMAVDTEDKVYMVMEYIEHELGVLLKNNKPEFSLSEKKRLILQILEGVAAMHEKCFFHRDLKTANLLYSNDGVVKICDFGLAKKIVTDRHTSKVATLWYRAPELLMKESHYGAAVDIWSVGCIMGEILTGKPLFNSDSELAALQNICNLVGTPKQDEWPEFYGLLKAQEITNFPNYSARWRTVFPLPSRSFDPGALTAAGLDLIKGLLTMNPQHRITAVEALNHPYFKESPLPQNIAFMPSAPETNLSAHRRRDSSEEFTEVQFAANGSNNGTASTGHVTKSSRQRVNVHLYLQHMDRQSTSKRANH